VILTGARQLDVLKSATTELVANDARTFCFHYG
jgi:hypothetical protein